MEEYGGLADFRPLHRVLPLARMKASAADVVLDHVRGVLAFDITHFAINDQIILPVDLLNAKHHDVGGKCADETETVRRLDIGMGGARKKKPETKKQKVGDQWMRLHKFLANTGLRLPSTDPLIKRLIGGYPSRKPLANNDFRDAFPSIDPLINGKAL